MLSYDQVKRRVSELSGLVTWKHHMCVNSCVGFTGPFADLEECPHPRCHQPRYDQDELRKSNGKRKTQDELNRNEDADYLYDDIFCGLDYLEAVENGQVNDYDTVVMLSIDGAQLYRNKKSNCWIYIWIILDLAPDQRYKIRNILPGGVIPGPGKPKNLDSFLFPGLAHVSALQKEGLRIWDGYNLIAAISLLFLLLALADTVAMAELSGSVGHHGKKGCRLLCELVGRNKPGGSHYYPALLRPLGIHNPSCDHPDIDIENLPSVDTTKYRQNLNNTGIKKASIFDGLPRILELPTCFPGDIMHQPVINLTALMFDLFCDCEGCRKGDPRGVWDWAILKGDVWVTHGKAVADAASYFPRSFDLVGIRIIYQRWISRQQLELAHKLLLEWVLEFELLYYQRKIERLHFVRQCVHSLTHLAPETHRLGPPSLSAQWTMEHVIGIFGSLIKQPLNPFANLTEQAKKVAEINAIVAMWPDLERPKEDPHGCIDMGQGYLLLGPKDEKPYRLSSAEEDALVAFYSSLPEAELVPQRSVY
ncbi:hypothetical protein BDM02DRAFT_3130490 [Thelephora ganbajun]|uniref:Uncharacterized protein n=1 Tax=Thelephora ganbajun TaxID=370292 RepID=A0ACB6ZAQ6_THEGA|nr:hypothetical protein BDM02DRAFT_3130490 [Thelephora ganbajun]